MRRLGVGALAFLELVSLSAAGCSDRPQSVPEIPRPAALDAQAPTVGNMRTLARLINDFAEAHGGRLPRSVSETLDYWQADESLGRDGWGRSIVYFASASHFTLLSLGKSGTADGLLVGPGGIPPGVDEEVDIVMIDGEWAQTPESVDRE